MTDKLILKALKGENTQSVPCWFMRQAGRYLPEYRELRQNKGEFLDMVYDPEAAAEVTLQPIRRFGMDAAILFSDILVIPHALGQKLEFIPGEGPKLEPLKSESDFAKLNLEKIDDTLSPIYETVQNVRAGLKSENFDHTALIGFAGSPWTVACYMVEGGGSKDFIQARTLAYSQPESFQILIDILVEATIQYLSGQIKAGAEVVKLFDSWAGALDHNNFERWVTLPTARIVAALKKDYPDIPVIGFARGCSIHAKDFAAETAIDCLAFDQFTPPQFITVEVPPALPLQGNLDPAWLMEGGSGMQAAAKDLLQAMVDRPFIFNLGHGIHKETPPENLAKLISIIREH